MALIDFYLCLCLLFLTGVHMYCTLESAHSSDTGLGSVETTSPFYLRHEACVTQTTLGDIRSQYESSTENRVFWKDKNQIRGRNRTYKKKIALDRELINLRVKYTISHRVLWPCTISLIKRWLDNWLFFTKNYWNKTISK